MKLSDFLCKFGRKSRKAAERRKAKEPADRHEIPNEIKEKKYLRCSHEWQSRIDLREPAADAWGGEQVHIVADCAKCGTKKEIGGVFRGNPLYRDSGTVRYTFADGEALVIAIDGTENVATAEFGDTRKSASHFMNSVEALLQPGTPTDVPRVYKNETALMVEYVKQQVLRVREYLLATLRDTPLTEGFDRSEPTVRRARVAQSKIQSIINNRGFEYVRKTVLDYHLGRIPLQAMTTGELPYFTDLRCNYCGHEGVFQGIRPCNITETNLNFDPNEVFCLLYRFCPHCFGVRIARLAKASQVHKCHDC